NGLRLAVRNLALDRTLCREPELTAPLRRHVDGAVLRDVEVGPGGAGVPALLLELLACQGSSLLLALALECRLRLHLFQTDGFLLFFEDLLAPCALGHGYTGAWQFALDQAGETPGLVLVLRNAGRVKLAVAEAAIGALQCTL